MTPFVPIGSCSGSSVTYDMEKTRNKNHAQPVCFFESAGCCSSLTCRPIHCVASTLPGPAQCRPIFPILTMYQIIATLDHEVGRHNVEFGKIHLLASHAAWKIMEVMSRSAEVNGI